MKLKTLILAAATLVVMASCGVPSQISYFQDTAQKDTTLTVPVSQIRLQPGDKVSIIINAKDTKISNLFNLPYTTRYIGAQTDTYQSTNTGISGYTIDADGNIDFPVAGKIQVAGLTREQVAYKVKETLEEQDLVKDPVVTVEFMNLSISVLGEVANAGRYTIGRDKITIIDAIAMAGDLTIFGRRDNVRVIREKDGVQQSFRVNLCSAEEVLTSPVYYIQQNDIIYVEPNDVRARQSTVNGNNVLSTSFWISIASLIASVINILL